MLGTWGLHKAKRLGLSAVKLFSKNSSLYDHDTLTSQTDGQTDGQLVGESARGPAFSWVH